MLRFTDHFNINKPQADLDFVDIPLNTDIPLYIDPYAISIRSEPFYVECNQMIIDYFDAIIKSISNGDTKTVSQYLNNLHEPDEIRFGVSQNESQGRGVGVKIARKLKDSFKSGRAVKRNLINEISDCELMIRGIGPDTISDMVTNIIKSKLIEFTIEQCEVHNIPTRRSSITLWDPETGNWKSDYYNLPYYRGLSIILVPVIIARYYPTYNHDAYYNDFCIEYLRAEHWDAKDALVRTFKNGEPRDVPKVWVKNKYPIDGKNFLVDFSEEHPEILKKYKKDAEKQSVDLDASQIEKAHREAQNINLEKLKKALSDINTGKENAYDYEDFIEQTLIGLFGEYLRNPQSQRRIERQKKIIDITFDNPVIGDNFFRELSVRRNIFCPTIIFECKNYSTDLKNPEFDQMLGRFGDHLGDFGIIICRKIKDKEAALLRCQNIYNKKRKFVMLLDDMDILELIRLRGLENENQYNQTSNFLNKKLDEIIVD